MALPLQFVAGIGLKAGIVILTVIVLLLIDPAYVTAYITVNYEIILIYIIAGLTLLYCIISIVMYGVMSKSTEEDEEIRLTNCALSEIVFSGAGIICWMIVCGIGGTVAQRTIIETGQYFGWLGACAGIIACLFAGIAGVFALILMEKIFSTDRKRYNNSDIANGQY